MCNYLQSIRFGGLMPLFLIYLYFIDWDIQFITLVTIVEAHSNIFTAAVQKRDIHWGAEPGIEPGPAVQQADALLFELRRTLWAAPHPRAAPHPLSCAAPYLQSNRNCQCIIAIRTNMKTILFKQKLMFKGTVSGVLQCRIFLKNHLRPDPK